MDAIGIDPNTGNIVIQEYKSSLTAPLTTIQKGAFKFISEYGGYVVGKGKGIFTKGFYIPPTIIEIIRPDN